MSHCSTQAFLKYSETMSAKWNINHNSLDQLIISLFTSVIIFTQPTWRSCWVTITLVLCVHQHLHAIFEKWISLSAISVYLIVTKLVLAHFPEWEIIVLAPVSWSFRFLLQWSNQFEPFVCWKGKRNPVQFLWGVEQSSRLPLNTHLCSNTLEKSKHPVST